MYVSAVWAMEIATKRRLGKLPQAAGVAACFDDRVADQAFAPLPISIPHAPRPR